MIGPVGPQADARAVIQIQPFPFLLPFRNLQAFFTPAALHAFVIHVPAFGFEQSRNPLIPVPTLLQSQASHVLAQHLFVIRLFLLDTDEALLAVWHTDGTAHFRIQPTKKWPVTTTVSLWQSSFGSHRTTQKEQTLR